MTEVILYCAMLLMLTIAACCIVWDIHKSDD